VEARDSEQDCWQVMHWPAASARVVLPQAAVLVAGSEKLIRRGPVGASVLAWAPAMGPPSELALPSVLVSVLPSVLASVLVLAAERSAPTDL
jgi:hypothetical protein